LFEKGEKKGIERDIPVNRALVIATPAQFVIWNGAILLGTPQLGKAIGRASSWNPEIRSLQGGGKYPLL